MSSPFQRNLLLALLGIGIVVQAFTVYIVLYLMREGSIKAAGTDTSNLAAMAARVVNRNVQVATRAVEHFDVRSIQSDNSQLSLSIPQPIVADDSAAESRYVVERNTGRVLWTNAKVPLNSDTLNEALKRTATSVVATMPSPADSSIIIARKLPPSGASNVGYLVVALDAEQVLAPAVSALGRSSSIGLLLVDSSGQVFARTSALEIPSDFGSTPYSIVKHAGREHMVSPARVTLISSSDAFWSVVVVRDLEDALSGYQAARDSSIGLAILFLGLIVISSLRLAQYLAAPIRTLRQGLELMVGANPDHRIALSTDDDLETIAQYINRLADLSGATKAALEREVAGATKTLAFEREKLASVLFGLAEGVIVCDRDLRVVLCNRAARGILTTTWRPARRGRGIYAYLDAARLKPLVDALGDETKAMRQGTVTLASGAIIQATAVSVGEGEEKNYIFLLRDITQLVNVDRQRNRTIHETLESLRGPLSSLLSFADILLDYKGLDEGRRNHFLAIMREESERLTQKLEEMQSLAETTFSPIEWSMEEIDLGTLAQQVVEQLQLFAEERLVQLAAVGGAAIVRGDAASLQQLVRRLFEFCIGFAAEGKRVEARWEDAANGWVEFRIAYEGRNLSPEEMESVFENQLYIGSNDRVELPTSREVVTIREIIKKHGGEVWAKNSENGALLSFILPAQTASNAKSVDKDSDTVGKQITALLGDGSFYDFRLADDSRRIRKARVPLSELSFVVIDLETTGLTPREGDEVVSIAGIRIERGEIVKEDYFYTLVDPRRSIPASSTRVHGITADMVKGQPTIEEVIPRFLEFKGDSVLAGHFVSFDLGFLNPKIESMGLTAKTNVALDTLMLSYALFRDWESYNLEDIAKHLGVKVVARHTALGDAYVTAQILLQLFKVMDGRGITTLGEALRVQRSEGFAGFLRGSRAGSGGEST